MFNLRVCSISATSWHKISDNIKSHDTVRSLKQLSSANEVPMKRNYFLGCFKVYFKKSKFPKFEALSILQALEVVPVKMVNGLGRFSWRNSAVWHHFGYKNICVSRSLVQILRSRSKKSCMKTSFCGSFNYIRMTSKSKAKRQTVKVLCPSSSSRSPI